MLNAYSILKFRVSEFSSRKSIDDTYKSTPSRILTMIEITIFFGLLALILVLVVIAEKISIPYPILLVIAGLGVAFIPGTPSVRLDPELVFLVFLPPLLFHAAWFTSWPDFVRYRRPISILAIWLVLATTSCVAIVAHYLIPGFSWPIAFALGAIVSPPDAVAAAAILGKMRIPRRLVTILEGESLVNDATGLIALKYALLVLATGSFFFWHAAGNFVLVALGGLAVGLGFSIAIRHLHRFIRATPTVEIVLSILAALFAYFIAETLHVSGVLAVVSSGLYLSAKSSELLSPQTRLLGKAFWEVLIFIINGIVFLLIGLQLKEILHNLSGYSITTLILYGLIISLSVILVRIVWVVPGALMPNLLGTKHTKKDRPNWRSALVVGWSGMRGVVSLAAAMALPLTLADGSVFAQRDLMLFLTFFVIFITLVVQGLTLPFLIRKLKIEDEDIAEKESSQIHLILADGAIEHIATLKKKGIIDATTFERLIDEYQHKINFFKGNLGEDKNEESESFVRQHHEAEESSLEYQRKLLLDLKRKGSMHDDALREVENYLDLEESRITTEHAHKRH